MTTLFLALLVGICNGLRTFTPPAVVAWAAHLGWLKLEGTLAMVGSLPAVVVFTVLAGAELVADKMPWIPNRTSIVGLLVRIVMGKLTGMCIAVAGGQSMWLGAVCGIGGAVAGTFGGYYARTRLVRALGKPDIYVALVEDLICVAASLWIVTRF
jgi:uncharacterized membrane protein